MQTGKIIRQLLLSLFLLLLVLPAYAAAITAGKVISLSGTMKAEAADSSVRTLKIGDDFYVGELLFTMDDSTAKLKFVDNALMTLRANTRYKIIAYWLDEIVAKAEPITDPEYKKQVKAKKEKIREIYRRQDPGGPVMVALFGKELAWKGLQLTF